MSLYTRLLGLDEPRIPVHGFTASVAERARGQATAADVNAAWGLAAAEQTELETLYLRFTTGVQANRLTREIFEDVLMLGEMRKAYFTEAGLKTRLGV